MCLGCVLKALLWGWYPAWNTSAPRAFLFDTFHFSAILIFYDLKTFRPDSNPLPFRNCQFEFRISVCTVLYMSRKQWHNGGGGHGGRGPPQRFLTRKFVLTYWEKRGNEKRGNGAEKKENQEREGGKMKMESGTVAKWSEDLSFFFFLSTFQN